MLLLGCKPPGRHTEQHDIFFGIADSIKQLIPEIKASWKEAASKIHIDAWREVTQVDGHAVTIVPRQETAPDKETQLFFINLGGYKAMEFDEFHYRMLVAAGNLEAAKSKAKKTAFFKHTTLPDSELYQTATSHIDDKYGVDVDDIYTVEDILSPASRDNYSIRLQSSEGDDDPVHLGYLKLIDL